MDRLDRTFLFAAYGIQIFLLAYFALRTWKFELALRWGWLIYALGVPTAILSIILLGAGKPWHLWLGGVLYAAWAAIGYFVDIARPVPWRSPIYPPVFLPYVTLFLGAQAFYWWPLGTLSRPSWFIYAALFVASTVFNLISHG